MKTFFTSESVTEGHPDKVCDQIADGVLDALLAQDPMSRCACEVTAEPGAVHIMGEITTSAKVDYEAVAREVIRGIGYTKPEYGFDCDSCRITVSLHEQSPDIAMGVDRSLETKEGREADELGAGDQGMMFGYACDETPELMPISASLAHRLTKKLTDVRKSGLLPYLRPDGKSQVTIEYDDGVPTRIDTVVLSAQHDPEVTMEQLRDDLLTHVILEAAPAELIDEHTRFLINPTGRFVYGGPAADTGLTGRKIIVDTYGGAARHGGGAFSGKDPTKVDRSAAYMARKIAKTIVSSGAAKRCEVQLGYAIGVAKPVSLRVDTFGTGLIPEDELAGWVDEHFDTKPSEIIKQLRLRRPIYRPTASYGHFGRELEGFLWEEVDEERATELEKLADQAAL